MINNERKICVLGGGSFGTAIANIAAKNHSRVHLWMRSERQQQEISETRINSKYLPRYLLDDALIPTCDLQEAVTDSDIVFVAVPSKAFRVVMEEARQYLTDDAALFSLTKGIEQGSNKLMSQILNELVPNHDIGVLSGPNLAKEIALNQLTATVVAADNPLLRKTVQEVLSTSSFRVYGNPDVYGVELAGALKNIYAIISGIAEALGMGENTRAMLITRSLAEMSRFAQRLGADPMTFIGLAGVGDLIVTCNSDLSRNFRVGHAIGQGHSLKQAVQQLGEVAEGVNTLRTVKEQADQMEIYMPLVDGLYEVLYEGKDVLAIADRLMTGDHAEDVEFMMGVTSCQNKAK